MSRIIFSGRYDALGKDEYRWVLDAVEKSNVRISVLFQAKELKAWRLDKYLFPEAIQARNRFLGFVARVLKDRLSLSKAQETKDIFSFIANARDPDGGSALTPTEVNAESTTLIVAGEKSCTVTTRAKS